MKGIEEEGFSRNPDTASRLQHLATVDWTLTTLVFEGH